MSNYINIKFSIELYRKIWGGGGGGGGGRGERGL